MSRAEKVVANLLETPVEAGTTRIKCVKGWVFVAHRSDGRSYVTASGHRAATVPNQDVNYYVADLVRQLGGRAQRLPTA